MTHVVTDTPALMKELPFSAGETFPTVNYGEKRAPRRCKYLLMATAERHIPAGAAIRRWLPPGPSSTITMSTRQALFI